MASRPNGFTLLELLAAVAIFGLVLSALAHGVHFGMLAARADSRVVARSDGLNEVDVALRHLIEAMDPGATDAGQPALLGGGNAMTFVTHLPDEAGEISANPVEATLLVDNQRRLVLRWSPLAGDNPGATQRIPTETQLLGGVSSMELAFWRPEGGWVGGWRSVVPPSMIRIRLVFADKLLRYWPDLVAAPPRDRS